jgi:anti-sigma B factor antagonist
MTLNVTVRQIGRIAILDLEGSLRLGQPEETLRDRLRLLLAAGTIDIAINLAHLRDIDSSGIGLVVRTLSQFQRAGGACVFFAPNERIRAVFKMVRLDSVLHIAPDEASALSRF